MTPRGVGLSVSVVLLWVAARSFGIPELQMAAVACLVLVAAAVLWATVAPLRVGVDRTLAPTTVWFDGQATVRLTVRNRGRLPTPVLVLDDQVPGSLSSDARTVLRPLRPGARVTVSYRVQGGQRGRFTLGPVSLRAGDPFGLVIRTRTAPAPGTLTVYPPIWHLPAGLPLGGSTASGHGIRRRSATVADDLTDIREYVRGDDLRSVHWPSTAHRGKLMVRRSDATRSPSAVVLLDRRTRRHLGHGATSSFESAVSAAASAGHHVASRGRSVMLIDEPLARPPRPLPWDAWLERLAAIGPAEVDLASLLRQVGEGIAGDGTLIAIVTVPDATELRALVRAGRGFTTRVALVVDAASHGGRGSDPEAEAAVAALRTAGWRASEVRRGDRLDECWSRLTTSGRSPRDTTTGQVAG